jgi:hypothetical protein
MLSPGVSRKAFKDGPPAILRLLAFSVSIFIGCQAVIAQSATLTTKQDVETVSFCDLFRNTDVYQGKTLTVTATYSTGSESQIFFEDACKMPSSEPRAWANAKFTGNNAATRRAFKRLDKFLTKYKTNRAEVTMIALFTDEFASGKIIAGCCRYTLDVKQILSIDKVEPTKVRSSR